MTSRFRLMTANLLHDRGDPHALEGLLAEVKPDLLVTQELSTGCASVIADYFPHHHLTPAPGFAGRGIASCLPASFGDIRMPVRSGTWAMVAVEGRLLRLVGMHLANPIHFPWWTSLRARSRQLEALFEWVDSGDDDVPLVVAGDMNASPRWPAYRRMADRWDDLVLHGAIDNDVHPERTWAWRPGWPRLLRIDHVFGLGVGVGGAQVVPIGGSDHHAVIVDVELRID